MGKAEGIVERYLKKQVEMIGGFTYKLEHSGRVGAPDRCCVFPGGIIVFVECKSDKGKTSSMQDRELLRIRNLGHKTWVVDTKIMVDALIIKIMGML